MTILWKKIEDIKQLSSLTEQWTRLNGEFNDDCLFTSPYWVLNWHEIFWQDNWHLHTFAAYKDNELIALLPFYYQKLNTYWSQNQLFFLGQGEEECTEVASEYLDILFNPKYTAPVNKFCADLITDSNFDTFNARAIKKDANILKIAPQNALVQNGSQYYVKPNNWQENCLSKNTKSKLRRSKNRLTSSKAEFTWVAAQEQEKYWNLMADLHQKRWIKLGQKGAFSDHRFNKFHTRLRQSQQHEQSAMSAILIEGGVIAIHYYLKDQNNLYYYQGGWDEEECKHLSPGFNLHVWSIENCSTYVYDFMMGSVNNSYKSSFNSEKKELYDISMINKPFKHLFLKVIQKIFLSNV